MIKRICIALPIFAITGLLIWFNVNDAKSFDIIWRYFGWANQTLAVFTLWAITSFLLKRRKGPSYLITLLPACFMTSVCLTFICTAKIGLNIPVVATPYLGVGFFLVSLLVFFLIKPKVRKEGPFGSEPE